MNNPSPSDNQLETGQNIREYTERCRANGGGPENIARRVRKVLDCMNDVGLNLPILLDAVFWGNDYLVTDGRAKHKRNALIHSTEFPQILTRWEKKSSTTQALLKTHALSMIKTAINAEMDEAVSELTVTGEEINEGKLLGMTQEELVKKLKPVTNTLWEILRSSMTRKDMSRNKHIHDPEKVHDTMRLWVKLKVS